MKKLQTMTSENAIQMLGKCLKRSINHYNPSSVQPRRNWIFEVWQTVSACVLANNICRNAADSGNVSCIPSLGTLTCNVSLVHHIFSNSYWDISFRDKCMTVKFEATDLLRILASIMDTPIGHWTIMMELCECFFRTAVVIFTIFW